MFLVVSMIMRADFGEDEGGLMEVNKRERDRKQGWLVLECSQLSNSHKA